MSNLDLRISLLTDGDKKALLDLLFKDYYFKDGVYKGQWNVMWFRLVDLGFLSDESESADFNSTHTYRYTELFNELRLMLNTKI